MAVGICRRKEIVSGTGRLLREAGRRVVEQVLPLSLSDLNRRMLPRERSTNCDCALGI